MHRNSVDDVYVGKLREHTYRRVHDAFQVRPLDSDHADSFELLGGRWQIELVFASRRPHHAHFPSPRFSNLHFRWATPSRSTYRSEFASPGAPITSNGS